MKDFVFSNTTKVYFGKDQLHHLSEEIAKFGKKVLLVYGGGSIKKIGLYDKVIAELKKADMTVFELGGVEPNPHHTTVNKGAALCKKEGIDVLLAVGGGSTIDATKAMAATAKYEGDDCWDIITGKAFVPDNLPIVAVLTLSATGSEMDIGGVISNVELNEKQPIFGPTLRPNVSFLDPTNTFSVNAYQTASGSADIMAHVFDVAYFTDQEEMDMLTRMQEEVLKTVVKYAPVAIEKPDDYEARSNLMWASSWALNGFLFSGVSQDAIAHMIEHELSAFYNITHGHGLAIIIPRWLTYILSDKTAPKIKRFGVNVLGVDASFSDMDGAKAAIAALEKFYFETLGLQSRLSDLGIDDKNFALMAKKACSAKGKLVGFTTLKIVANYFSLVDPETHFDYFNTQLTGIDSEKVKDAPNFAELWKKIEPIMSKGILVAHNAVFDMGVLRSCLQSYGITWKTSAEYLCTVQIGRRVLPDMKHNLNVMCDHYGIALDHHQADSDSRACAEILLRYMESGVDVSKYVKRYDLSL